MAYIRFSKAPEVECPKSTMECNLERQIRFRLWIKKGIKSAPKDYP